MEISKDDTDMQPTQHAKWKKGGLKTMPFIIANEVFEKVAGVGLHANMVFYLKNEYNFTNATATNILAIWTAVSNFTPVFGAFVSDSYLGRFRTIILGTIVALSGMITLWSTALFASARPPDCSSQSENCVSPKPAQLLLLFSSFVLMAIGAGGIRPCSLAFGADQFNDPNNPKNERVLQTLFNWYYASVGISVTFSVLFLVYLQDKAGWKLGFGVPVGFMFISIVMFVLGSSMYIKVNPNKSLFSGFAKVISAAWKKRKVALPTENSASASWFYQEGSTLKSPKEKLMFLNKACLITNPEEELDENGLTKDPWSLCTVREVEELKALIKVLPVWSSGIIVAVSISQHGFPLLQASTMDRHFIGKLQIPAGSYVVFAILTLTFWVAIYDRIMVPLLAKLTYRSKGLTNMERIGTGIIIASISCAVAGIVEHKRRAEAAREGFLDHPRAVINMSANWLVPQFCIMGLAEGLNAIGQIEFYYSQFPKTMSSIAVALFTLGMGVGNLVASLIISIVNQATKGDGKTSWLSNNLNRGHYDYYYWLLGILCGANFFYFLLCRWLYGPYDDIKVWDEDTLKEEDNHKH